MNKLNKPKEIIPEDKIIAGFEPLNHKNDLNSFNIESNFNIASGLINSGDLNGGKDLLNKILEFDPEHKESIKALSNLYLKIGKSELAIKLVFNYLKNNPYNSEFMNLMGVYLNSIGELKLAGLFYKKSLLFAEGNEIILKNLELAEDTHKKDTDIKISSKFLYLLKLTENKKILKPSIALCMIVKNEEINLSRCLSSIKDIINEIVIVDTGSTDKTKEIARSFGAEVRNFEWVDDFSVARNESIKDIKSDWILFMDADEYLDNSSKTFLDNLEYSDKPLAFYTKIISFANKTNSNITTENLSVRLFNNKKGFKFAGNIHEQLILSGSTEAYERISSSIILRHTGYLEDEMNEKNKIYRNFVLLIKALRDNPENAFNYYNMGVQFLTVGKYRESIEYFYKTIEKLDGRPATYLPFCYSGISLAYCSFGKYEEAAKVAEEAIELAPDFKEAYYCLANAQFCLNDNENALVNFKKTLEIKDKVFLGGTRDPGVSSWKCLNSIGTTYLKMEDHENALKYLWEAYKIQNKSAVIILNLLVAHKNIGNLDTFLQVLSDIKDVEFSVCQTQRMVNIFLLFKKFDEAFMLLNKVLDFYTEKNIKKDMDGMEISILKKNIADIYFGTNDYKNAVINYEDFFKISEGAYDSSKKIKEDEKTYNKIGLCFYKLRQYSQAADYFSKAIDINNKNPNYFYNLGNCFFEAGNIEDAKLAYRCALILDSNHNPSIADFQIAEISEKIKI